MVNKANQRPYLLCSLLSVAGILLLGGCVAPPRGVQPVTDFELTRYMGKWYEIARLDHSFERGLTDVTAEYLLAQDGSVTVINRGYDPAREEWREVKGRGLAIGPEGTGSLKVRVGAPFYGGYHVIALDKEHYQWAVVSGPTRDFLWILARGPELPSALIEHLKEKLRELKFAADDLIMVQHGTADPM